MKAIALNKRTGMLLAAAVLAASGVSQGFAGVSGPAAAGAAHAPAPVVLDNGASTPLELLLFVHRPDLPLRTRADANKDKP